MAFKNTLSKVAKIKECNSTVTFIKRNQERPSTPEFLQVRTQMDLNTCCEIQKQINRDIWQEFLTTAHAKDMRRISQYFARIEGRKAPGGRPMCLDPLRDEKNNRWRLKPREKADLLGSFFAGKMAQRRQGKEIEVEQLRKMVK